MDNLMRDINSYHRHSVENYPTHQIVHREDSGLSLEERAAKAIHGKEKVEIESYCGASKHFTKVNPNLKDPKHIHNAP